MKHLSSAVLFDPLSYLKAMGDPFVALGIVLLILWLLTRMALLSWADLSFVLPLTGLGYILAALFGTWFLSEVVSPVHWLGTLLVFAGTGLVGMTTQKTTPEICLAQESE